MLRVLSFLLLSIVGSAIVLADQPPVPVPLGSPKFAPSSDHPFGWRGDGSGRFPGATPVLEWSATKNVRWSAAVGRGYASPILTDDAVLIASEPNVLVSLARADGAVRWKLAVTPAALSDVDSRTKASAYEPPKDGSGLAAATPVTDGKTVYAVFANGIVIAVGLDGKQRWSAYIDAEPSLAYGRSSSPLLIGGKLIVHMTNLYAFDAATGKQLWTNDHAKSAYGTPTVLTAGGVEVIVTPAGDAFRVADGERLNSGIAQATHSSPIAGGDVAYFVNSAVSAVRLDAKFKEKELWNGTIPGEPFCSPVLHDGVLYAVTSAGELYAWDAGKSGDQTPIIESRPLFEDAGGGAGGGASPATYASLTLAGKHLFLGSNKGETVVLEATREAKVVAQNKIRAGSGASPVFSGDEMYLRDGERMYCIGKQDK